MNVRCTFCNTTYRIDPTRLPPGGVNARCARCQRTFRIEPTAGGNASGGPASASSGAAAPRATAPAAAAAPPGIGPGSPQPAASNPSPAGPRPAPGTSSIFGPQDPDQRAKRIARALVSDIVAYHQDRWERSLAAGTLREDFREEI